MPIYNLIPNSAFINLPEHPAQAFLHLIEELEDNFEEREGMHGVDMMALRSEFVEQAVALAGELAVGALEPTNSSLPSDFNEFRSQVSGLKTRLRLRTRMAVDPATVRLIPSTRVRLEFEIERLRERVGESDLSDKKKEALYSKLDELLVELRKERVSLSSILKAVAAVATILGGTATALAKAPEAAQTVLTIIELIGDEKSHEDEQPALLGPPPKALPAPVNDGDIA